ncbi:MAG TPA: MBL fold metallo-hydrolase [Bryobacteraceae bacterium]|nr:MBL fold metallo-hydrolase [Bryobacteraceae bacterium]HOQ45838.1 MBL fold metallo-hydrolase [Bryobacteraceae bacterium]HPQ17368.1 MBL fold metallo-hydrolase [Bryobacteraceae bacterium]HPU70953.1 MBL fold metallo-hydrolase [Bryobacteraceae bacterium]
MLPRWNGARPARRAWLGGAALAGISGIAAYAYRAAPAFWKQYARDMRRPIMKPPRVPDPHRWSDRGLFAAWVGHSTVLLKIDGYTILTDPVFSDHAGIHLGPFSLGLKRLVAPALDFEDLPRIDLVLLSHAHMDHTDLPSLRRLESRHTSVVCAVHTSDLLRPPRYSRVTELAWGQAARLGPVTVRAVEVNHWGARMRTDRYRGYNGYLIESGSHRVLFAGDTAATTAFRKLRTSRPIDLAIMPIGAYNPWIRYHCTPEQAWQMANDAGADFVMPVHHQTFSLGREPLMEPIERFYRSAGHEPERIAVHRIGQEFRYV